MRQSKMKRAVLIAWMIGMLYGCTEHNSFYSSVPTFPVHIEINTTQGMFVHFVPENVTAHMTIDAAGYHFSGQTWPLAINEAYGYSGIVVFIDGIQPYGAYDLCCPHCLRKNDPCYIDGIFAVCPNCHEQYDIYTGYGIPTTGIGKEPLRRYRAQYDLNRGIIFISQGQ